ncbi:hypothetical protein Seera_045 [Serratia phage Seera]|uniref:Uncharacterized protein n=2 Tax=Teetrevirus TaxID=2732693 RepID=A0AAV1MJE8_9CAUD|nr:hypothetical protein Seera_045 [Serratia phage Seera]CAK6604116.1 unknown function [Klebsiella phage vB_Kpn_K19PH14C4P1]
MRVAFMIITYRTNTMSKLLATSKIEGQCTVTLREYYHGSMGSTYVVRYGKQVTHWVNPILAQEDYQACVIHQATCAGWND